MENLNASFSSDESYGLSDEHSVVHSEISDIHMKDIDDFMDDSQVAPKKGCRRNKML